MFYGWLIDDEWIPFKQECDMLSNGETSIGESLSRVLKEKQMKIYIAGPMRGYPNFNRDAFNDMAQWLTAKGYEVFNPIAIDVEEYGSEIHNSPTGSIVDVGKFGMTAQNVLARDAKLLASADAIYLLTGWEKSTGAQAEWAMARAMGLQIFYQAGIEDYEWKEHFDGASN